MDIKMKHRAALGAIKPEGWLKDSLVKNMQGCIGHLDELVPELLVKQEIYGRDRLGHDAKLTDLGRKETEEAEMEGPKEQYLWWNSESQSNWLDGYCRSAFLLDYDKWKEKAADLVWRLSDTQDEDGYIGIYREELRFHFQTENGELWAQSTLLRVLLGYYEAVRDKKILHKVELAAQRIMQGYPIYKSCPFSVKDSSAGHCHGLTIVDALYQLYCITGNQEYVDYAVWLYEDFSRHPVSEEDLKMCNIDNPDYFFRSHGVHTYEHIRALIIAAYTKKEYQPLLEKLLTKLPFYLTPSGAPIGDEWIFGRTADATITGYEFCSVHELMDSYLLLMSMSGDLSWADKAEWLYYNAAQGMMHPLDSSIMYCKTDNCYEANEYRNPGDGHYNPRYKYSPTHQDAAVCCVPNSGRIVPYFISSMFLKTESGYEAVLYGPCNFKDTRQETEIIIKEYTDYPYAFNIRFEVTVSNPSEFSISFRFPGWADQLIIDNHIYDKKDAEENRITVHKIWEDTTVVEISLTGAVQCKRDFNGEVFFSRGPLVYALPIESEEIVLKEMEVQGFSEKAYLPVSRESERACIKEQELSHFQYRENVQAEKSREAGTICGSIWVDNAEYAIQLIPMGHTILRKVTFSLI